MKTVSNKDRLELEIQVYTEIVEGIIQNEIDYLRYELIFNLKHTHLAVRKYNYLASKIEARIDQLTSLLDTYKKHINSLKLSLELE